MAVQASQELVELAAHASRFAIATVFLLAGAAKLSERDEFARAVRNYDLLPSFAARLVARWLPAAEVGAALLLGLGVAIVPVTAFVVMLLAVFIGAVGTSLLRKKEMDCGCFGGSGAPRRMTWWVVARNALLLAMALLVLASPPVTLALWPGWAAASSGAVTKPEAVATLLTAPIAVLAAFLAQEAWRVRRLVVSLTEVPT